MWCCPRVSAPVRLVLNLTSCGAWWISGADGHSSLEIRNHIPRHVAEKRRRVTAYEAVLAWRKARSIQFQCRGQSAPSFDGCRVAVAIFRRVSFTAMYAASGVPLSEQSDDPEPRVAFELLPPIESNADMRALRTDPRGSQSKRVISAKRDASAELRWCSVSSQPTTRCGCHQLSLRSYL